MMIQRRRPENSSHFSLSKLSLVMFPFHKIYSAIFKSFNIHSETDALKRLIEDGVTKVMIIKRSWIFGLAMIWIPILIAIIGGANIAIVLTNKVNPYFGYPILIGVSVSLIFFVISVVVYILHFRAIYDVPHIEENLESLMPDIEAGDKYFITFFDQTILNQIVLVGLILWTLAFYATPLSTNEQIIHIVSIVLLFLQMILLGRYRKRMMDLEMDYNIAIPGKILFVNQSGMLSSSQAVEGTKVKTVTARYPSWISSFFQYGTIEIMTEGGESNLGTTSMFYVPHPNETAFLIQTLLTPDPDDVPKETPKKVVTPTQQQAVPQKAPPTPENQSSPIGPREVTYDVK